MYDTEEEQIEALKRLWRRYGNWALGALLLILVAYLGWHFYQNADLAKREAAAELYSRLSDLPADERSEVLEQLQNDYDGTGYATLAALNEANQAVNAQDYEEALAQLDGALDNADAILKPILLLRLARLHLALEDHQTALATLDEIQAESYDRPVNELRGDIFYDQNNLVAARAAYQEAYAVVQEDGAEAPYLKMKLDDLAVAEPDEILAD